MDIFELAQELLDAHPDRAEAEQIIGLKMKEIFPRNEIDLRTFNDYEVAADGGPFARFWLRLPKSRGGTSMDLDLRAGPTRAEILKRFGPQLPDDSRGEKYLWQKYKAQSLTWVFGKNGNAEHLWIQNGR